MNTQFDYIPSSFKRVPTLLNAANSPASAEEIQSAQQIRSRYLFDGAKTPFMTDIVRAWRLLRGCSTYLEIGIFDRGNLAYTSSLADDNATLIGLDIEENKTRDDMLRTSLKPGQKYHSVIGDSRSDETVSQVARILNGRLCDAVFIDGGHDASCAMSDYARYADFVREGGLVLFHDALWEGDSRHKGVSQALMCIDRVDAVYSVVLDHPVHRYLPPMFRGDVWGCVGIIIKPAAA